MSYTEIFLFDNEGNAEIFAEVENVFRGAFSVWNIMGDKYCGHGASMVSIKKTREIWNLVDNPKVPINERIVLFTTLDRCLIKKEDIPMVARAFREFHGDTSLKEQAEILTEIFESWNCIAVGWNQNSVSHEQWFDCNCIKDTDHFWLFEELQD